MLLRAIIDRDAVPPPYLPRYAPVADILHPIQIHLSPSLRVKLYLAFFHRVYRRLCERFHLYEPLEREIRLHCGVTPVAMADCVLMCLCLYEEIFICQLLEDGFTRLKSIHARKMSGVLIHFPVRSYDFQGLKVVTLRDIEVVGVMRRRDFDSACAKFFIHEIVRDYLDLAPDQGQNQLFPDKLFVSLIFWIYCDCDITQHCLGPGRGDYYSVVRRQSFVVSFKRIPYIIQFSFYVHVRRFLV